MKSNPSLTPIIVGLLILGAIKQFWPVLLLALVLFATNVFVPRAAVRISSFIHWILNKASKVINPFVLINLFVFIILPVSFVLKVLGKLSPRFSGAKASQLQSVNRQMDSFMFEKPF